ncbi:MAG: hypothetical protein KGQ46_12355 [Hyphomicrobiales bacterium]|nr:hypothetical protein [Hyphomicrobiales bacterium]MDE2113848.1 hypothetical protein [Hyphomicrobiales bacterium]
MKKIGFQAKVNDWIVACFGTEAAKDEIERNHRFLEEALELVQSCGCTKEEAIKLIDYVFDRPAGDKAQEVGGVLLTLSGLCTAQKIDMQLSAKAELARVWMKIVEIREKQRNKPKNSPLPAEAEADLQKRDGNARTFRFRLRITNKITGAVEYQNGELPIEDINKGAV